MDGDCCKCSWKEQRKERLKGEKARRPWAVADEILLLQGGAWAGSLIKKLPSAKQEFNSLISQERTEFIPQMA